MKKVILYILFIAAGSFGLSSCMESSQITFDGLLVEFDEVSGSSTGLYLRLNNGVAAEDRMQINLVGAHQSNAVNVTYEVDPSSTAVPGLHYNLTSSNPISIPAGESFGYIDFEVLADNIEAGEEWSLIINITGADVPISENYKSIAHSIQISCPSDLAGIINYSTEPWCGAPTVTGQVEFVAEDGGLYKVVDPTNPNPAPDNEDFSYGAYYGCYGGTATLPGGDLRILDVCGTISPVGVSRWGEVYSYNSVTLANGNMDLIIDWVNDYAEGGVSTLTRADGNPWPNLTN